MKIIEKVFLMLMLAASCAATVLINIAIFMIEEHVEIPLDRVSVYATNEAPDYGAKNVLDDDSATIWHTAWVPAPAAMPQSLIFEFSGPVKLSEISVLPRQDMENGRITNYHVYIKNQGEFERIIEDGAWEYSDGIGYKSAAIDPPAVANAVRLEVVSGQNGFASAAEVRFKGVILSGTASSQNAAGNNNNNTAPDSDLPFSDINFIPSDRTKVGVYTDDEHPDYLGRYILDGDTATFWHTDWENGDRTFPFRIYINLGGEHTVTGLRFLGRQDGNNNGDIFTCALYSENGLEGADISPVEAGVGSYREIPLKKPIKAAVLIIEVTAANGDYASMAELSILTGDAGVITPSDAFTAGS